VVKGKQVLPMGIAEVIIYTKALLSGDEWKVGQYLSAKYDIRAYVTAN